MEDRPVRSRAGNAVGAPLSVGEPADGCLGPGNIRLKKPRASACDVSLMTLTATISPTPALLEKEGG